MKTKKNTKSAVTQFAENLAVIPKDIVNGALLATADEDGKLIINAYANSFVNQFQSLSALILEQEKQVSEETLMKAEELIKVTAGIELTQEVKALSSNIRSCSSKIGLVGFVQSIKRIMKWLIIDIFKSLPVWINDLIALIDEILNEMMCAGSEKLATILSRKEQNHLAELAKLAILKREERYLFEIKKTGDDC